MGNMIDVFGNGDDTFPDYDPWKAAERGEDISKASFLPIVSKEDEEAISNFYKSNPQLKQKLIEEIRQEAAELPNKRIAQEAWIQTFSGKKFTPLAPRVEDICVEDIAHALSNICRFTGHCANFYSVAQHSVLVSYICDSENALHGLLHDASEAYCQDIASPIKKTDEFKAYRDLEARIQNAICRKFDLSSIEPSDVKKADQLLLATEARDLMTLKHPNWKLNIQPLPFTIVALPPGEAKQLFLNRFRELTQK